MNSNNYRFYTDDVHCVTGRIENCLIPQNTSGGIRGGYRDFVILNNDLEGQPNPPIPYNELADERTGEPSAVIRQWVNRARQRRLERYSVLNRMEKDYGLEQPQVYYEPTKIHRYKGSNKGNQIFSNAQLTPKLIKEFCPLEKESKELLHMAISRLGLSARAYDRIIKVARTIVDLADSKAIKPEHISRAPFNTAALTGISGRIKA